MVADRLSVARRGSGSLSKRVVYEVTERMKLVVGPGRAAEHKTLFGAAAASTFVVRARDRCAERFAGGSSIAVRYGLGIDVWLFDLLLCEY